MRINALQSSISRKLIPALLICVTVLAACGTNQNGTNDSRSASTHPDVLASFFVELPEPLPDGSQLSIEWIDQLNSLQLSPNYQLMEKVDERHYQLDVPSKKGALLQYRYVLKNGSNMVEIAPDGNILPSRFFYITEHTQIQDSILGFTLGEKNFAKGRLAGILQIKDSGQAAVDAIVTTAGLSTTTAIDGKFKLEGVPVGVRNVTIFSPSGAFEPFEQQAIIEENNVTPMEVVLSPRDLVNVTFIVKVPANTPPDANIQLFGNISTLGDSFAGLFGGTSLVQKWGITLSKQSGRQYLAVVQLPIDTDLHYMYSSGDTFWNGEINPAGQPIRHSIFIDRQDMIVEDSIASWMTPNYGPVTFKFFPPLGTPESDDIQIQFNTFGWMDPIKMRPVEDGSYVFQLFNPLNFSAPVDYRFCRSQMCGTIDPGTGMEQVLSFEANSDEQILQTVASQWSSWSPLTNPTVVTTEISNPRESDFRAAVELTDEYRPPWTPNLERSLENITGVNANAVIIPVTWSFRMTEPVWLSPKSSTDIPISEIQKVASLAHQKGLRVYLMAQTRYTLSADDFWRSFPRGQTGWDQWFESISDFYRSAALLASNIKANGLILGDESVSEVMGGSVTSADVLTSFPENGFQRWENIFAEVNTAYSGETWVALNYSDLFSENSIPLDQLTGIYLLNLGRIADTQGDVKTYSERIAEKLDNDLYPLVEYLKKKIWIGLDVPSIDGAYFGCVNLSGNCVSSRILNFPFPPQPGLTISLQEQANLYNAAIPEINRRDWIDGISTRRFLSVGSMHDQSSSIRGKPASDIIWYWYGSMTGKTIQ